MSLLTSIKQRLLIMKIKLKDYRMIINNLFKINLFKKILNKIYKTKCFNYKQKKKCLKMIIPI